MEVTSSLLAKFEINVAALESLSFLLLDKSESVNNLNKLQLKLSRHIVFNELTELERQIWCKALGKLEEISEHDWDKNNFGHNLYLLGERAHNNGLSLEANPYPVNSYGFKFWATGWKEKANANNDEMLKSLDDMKNQLPDGDHIVIQSEEDLHNNSSTSTWLKEQLVVTKERDPVDALNDVEVLMCILETRLKLLTDKYIPQTVSFEPENRTIVREWNFGNSKYIKWSDGQISSKTHW